MTWKDEKVYPLLWRITDNVFGNCKHAECPKTKGHEFESQNVQIKHGPCCSAVYDFKDLYKAEILKL